MEATGAGAALPDAHGNDMLDGNGDGFVAEEAGFGEDDNFEVFFEKPGEDEHEEGFLPSEKRRR